MGKQPAFQLYAADFYMDTASWSIEEVGVYTRLLFYQWVNGSIPDDLCRIARIAGCSLKRIPKVWSQVKLKFSKRDDGNLINERLEETRQKQLNYAETRRKAAETRWEKNDAYASTGAMHTECSSSSSSSSVKDKTSKEEQAPLKIPSKDEIENQSKPQTEESIKRLSKHLYDEKIFPDIYAFVNKTKKHKANLRAVVHTLTKCVVARPVEPWAYCVKVMSQEDGNFNARDYEKNKGSRT